MWLQRTWRSHPGPPGQRICRSSARRTSSPGRSTKRVKSVVVREMPKKASRVRFAVLKGEVMVNQLRHLIPHRPVPPAAARGSFEKGAVSTAVRPLHRHQLAAGAPGSPGPALDVHGVPAPVHDRRRSTAGACLDPGWRGRQNQLRRVLARVTTPAVQNSHVFCSNYLDRELHQARRWLSSRSLARFRCSLITTRSLYFVEGRLVQRCRSRVPLTLW